VILLVAVSFVAGCATPRREPPAPPVFLPPPCDPNALEGRANLHRYEHCFEQMTVRKCAVSSGRE